MSKFCPKCGEKLVDEAKFCKNCGENIERISTQTSVNPTHDCTIPAVEESYTALIVIGYVMAVMIPIIGFIVGIFLWTRDSQKAKKHGLNVIVVSVIISALIVLTASI